MTLGDKELILCMLGYCFLQVFFSELLFFLKNLSGTLSECQNSLESALGPSKLKRLSVDAKIVAFLVFISSQS